FRRYASPSRSSKRFDGSSRIESNPFWPSSMRPVFHDRRTEIPERQRRKSPNNGARNAAAGIRRGTNTNTSIASPKLTHHGAKTKSLAQPEFRTVDLWGARLDSRRFPLGKRLTSPATTRRGSIFDIRPPVN